MDRVLQLGPTLVAAAIAKSQQDLHVSPHRLLLEAREPVLYT